MSLERLADLRLAIYRTFADLERAPTPAELATEVGCTPDELAEDLRVLAEDRSAIVLIPGSTLIWMAEPFSGVPTHFRVRSGNSSWFGNCVWDALGILALLRRDGFVETQSPVDGDYVRLEVRGGELVPSHAVIHFAVPARDWWQSIGFT